MAFVCPSSTVFVWSVVSTLPGPFYRNAPDGPAATGCARVYAGLPPIIFSCVALCASTWDIRKAGQTDCDCAGLSLITSVQGILHERMRTRKFVEERSEGTGTR